MTPSKLNEILAAHTKWLRGAEGGVRADLCDVNLAGADLRGVNLAGANLTRAYLAGASLSCANLTDANLTRACLTNATLTATDLTDANLTRADLRDANLTGANMYVACADHVHGISIRTIGLPRHRIVMFGGQVQIGCHRHTLAYWIENFEEIGESNYYTPKQIREYGAALSYLLSQEGDPRVKTCG